MGSLAPYVPPPQRGVLYFSSIPRDMRPPEVCLHFNAFGSIHRTRFVPYPKKERRPGGPLLPLQYKEGWIEYASTAEADAAAAYMNNQPVNCKRGRRCYGQLWTVRCLEGQSWNDLVEGRESERRARRTAEVEARRQERDGNEAYRRMVMLAAAKRQPKTTRRTHASEPAPAAAEQADSAQKIARRAAKKAAKSAAAPVHALKAHRPKKAARTDKR